MTPGKEEEALPSGRVTVHSLKPHTAQWQLCGGGPAQETLPRSGIYRDV